ncbi:glycerol-3-phosphate dehydrogenase/oxidase [Microbacterium sp. IEGM 1404]|uniref:glycerol-3-phosphate dehydrogenase/oxidase n=1 Tax=Microbacterium sp. IEGM 1404 TaxID=3047084 RepID=UPI0024B6BBEC|nr:glycerol-3-phosphate dehydrogenase/oxidase [Microbacterium sp. IEGM 1404]MDI9891119.1 glycerol-3-phosphate dehydrogenase/oxidase [Microbacterium sp. IEGM 1404]
MTSFSRADAAQLTGRTFDVLVVGGGINGVAIARDAATRGLSVALIERGDLAVGTSSWNSRLIHGGLRYLEHGEIPLVYESLHDRECLFRIAPHLVTPLPFVVPLYGHNHLPGWMFRIGLVMYDILSLRKSVPAHRYLSRKAIDTELPGLDKDRLSGAVRYYDGQVTYPERLVIETALSAADAGAVIGTYIEASDILREGTRVVGVSARDLLTDETFEIRASAVVNAAGPWVDELGQKLGMPRQIGGTTGTHFVVDAFPGAPDACIYFEARSDNRAILVIPWNGRYLIGTTDDRFDGDPGAVRGTDDEVAYLLAETNLLIPTANLTADDVLFTYTGVRPLPYRPGVKAGNIPRSHLILSHDDAPGLVTIVGGKLTPHLSLGKQTVDKIARHLGRTLSPSRTARMPLPGAVSDRWSGATQARQRLSATLPWEPALAERLVDVYGAGAAAIRDLAATDPRAAEVFGHGRGAVVAAEVLHAIRAEGAATLVDILHRRTLVGLEPALGTDVERPVAELAARELGWDRARIAAELAAQRTYIERLQGGVARPRTAAPTTAETKG